MSLIDSINSGLAGLEQALESLEQSQADIDLRPAQALWHVLNPTTTNPAGSSFGSTNAVPSSLTQLPNVGNMPYYRQQGNACGTTTLAEIMSYLGVPMNQADVDNGIRRMNTFTAPNDMIDFARDHGLEAEGYNNASFDQIKSMIDAGCPVQAMVDGNDSVSVNDAGNSGNFSVSGLHYIAITGYGTDPATGEQYITYHDPNRSDGEQQMSVSDFEKMWGNVHYEGMPTGFNNYFIAYGKPGTNLPPGNDDGVQGTNSLLDGITNVTNGLNRIYSPDNAGDFVHGLFEFPSGIVQGIGGFVGGVAELGANWLHNEVQGIPVLGNVVEPIADIVGGAGAVVGDVFDGVGKAGNDIGGAFGSLFNGDFGGFASGLGSAAVDVGNGIVNAAGDALSAVGNAVSDFFSGW